MADCIKVSRRTIDIAKMQIGGHFGLLDHKKCGCRSCCRRVAVWADPRAIVDSETWAAKLVALVRFGAVECDGVEVEVDVKTGVILDLMGSAVQVDVMLVEATGTVPPLTLGAMSACCGAGAARGCATRTTARFTLAEDESTPLIPVPPFAYAVQLAPLTSIAGEGNPFVADTFLVQFGSGTSGFASLLASATGDVVPDPWPIVNGARSLFINNGGTDTIAFEVVFLIGV